MVKISFIASGIILGLATISSASASLISRSFLDQALTDYATNTALDLKANQSDLTALSNKIGTLPEGITVQGMYEGWTDSNGEYIKGLSVMAKADFTTYDPLGDTFNSGLKPESDGYLDVLARLMGEDGFAPFGNSVLAPFWYLTRQAMRVGEIPRGRTAAAMIDEINTKIGTLPSGDFPGFPGLELLSNVNLPLTYPTSLAELITAIFGNSETGGPGLLQNIILGFPRDTNGDGQFDSETGLLTNHLLAKNAIALANSNTAKIGTLPSGSLLGNSPVMDALFKFTQGTDTPVYPNSLSDLINQLYSNNAVEPSIINTLLYGFKFDDYDYVGIVPAIKLGLSAKTAAETAQETATEAKTAADANTARIGDLPTEYTTVGAALTAMKSDIDAKNLPSTSDDGQYVLSAKKVGDTITYTWVKMDLTNEEQAQ